MAQDILPSKAETKSFWPDTPRMTVALRFDEECCVCTVKQEKGSPGVRHYMSQTFVCEECVKKIRAVVER